MDVLHIIQEAKWYLARKAPFFATLAFYTQSEVKNGLGTAATDGNVIWFDPDFCRSLPKKEFLGLYLHEVLHVALQHNQRRQNRDPRIWNIACDYIINGAILNAGFSLPAGGLINSAYWEYSSEELYEHLYKQEVKEEVGLDEQTWGKGDVSELNDNQSESEDSIREWQRRIQTATNMQDVKHGNSQGNLSVEFELFLQDRIDWKQELWEFCTVYPSDFIQFDRRFIHKGLYIDALEGEQLELFVCVDTSASIRIELLNQFMGEIAQIQQTFPNVVQYVYFCDTELFGPFIINHVAELQKIQAKGRGGTSFIPIFKEIQEQEPITSNINQLLIYLTDGYGDFPSQHLYDNEFPVLWVRTPDGLDEQEFPFGKVISIH